MINKKNKIIKTVLGILFLTFVVFSVAYSPAILSAAVKGSKAKTENSEEKEVKRVAPIPFGTSTRVAPTTLSEPITTTPKINSLSVSGTTLGPNLISNPSIENSDVNGNPVGWTKGGYGTNTRNFTYPVAGSSDAKGAGVTISNYVNGDAKWFFTDVSVTTGKTYQFADYSKSDVPTIIDVRFKMNNGTYIYSDIAFVNPSAAYQNNSAQITVPANAVSMTIFHLINRNGSLSVDDFSLNEIISDQTTPPPPPVQNNLVTNGDFETMGAVGMPASWIKGGFGTNTRNLTYPVLGVTGSKSASVSISSYASGDAKWFFSPISVSSGIYTYSDQYSSNVPSYITVQYNKIDGSTTYKDIATLPASNGLSSVSIDFSVDVSVKTVSVMHIIKSVGIMTIDNVSVLLKSKSSGVFNTGAVTLRFDDGTLSQYQNAIPKMQSAGIKGTFYIVSKQTADDGFPGFMSQAQIKDVFAKGFEIGAHTRTHAHLTALTTTEQQDEIVGSRNDLLALGVGPILSFAYPFGEYNSTTISIVKNAGFTSAASTIDGFVSPTSDKYQLERQNALVTTTIGQYKQWIDDAVTNKKWLIIAIHHVDYSGEYYSITPDTFNQLVDYIKLKQVPVVTITEGLQSI